MMDTAAARAGRENLSTANEMARLLQRVWQAERGGLAAGRRMVDWMKLVRGEIGRALPGIAVAAKTGELTGVRNEAAIVYLERRPYALVVLQGFQQQERNLVGEVAKLVHGHFQRLAEANAYGNRVWAP
jgi:beta-lactamase class A